MKYGRYEIKKVQHLKAMSEETNCFSLDLYVDGQKFAAVGNAGHGGCNETHPYPPFTWKDVERVTEEMKEDKFLVDFEYEPFDTAVGTLFALHAHEKDMARLFKTKVVFYDGDKMYTVGSSKSKTAPTQANIDQVAKKYPSAVILNGLGPAGAAMEMLKRERVETAKMMASWKTETTPGPKA